MKKSTIALVIATAAFGAACSKTTPASPTVSFTAPVASQPANGASYKFEAQNVVLTITNVVHTGSPTVTYAVDVASDTNFSNKVFTRSGITEGSGGTTSIQVPSLGDNATYYWRWTPTVDGVVGQPSGTLTFVVQQQLIVNTPAAVAPATGFSSLNLKPTFTATNATRQGLVGAITYEFQVSASSAFTTLVATATVAEGSGGQTSWTPANSLPIGPLFWRVRALDTTDSITTGFSAVPTFTLLQFLAGPTVSAPVSGATITVPKPAFVAKNASRQGSISAVTYDFQVSTSSTFATITTSASITEQTGGSTSWTPTVDLPEGAIYWRVRVRDPVTGETTAYSTAGTFNVQLFNMKNAVIVNNPANLGSWAETATITSVTMSNGFVEVDFDKREGPGAWPEVAFGSGSIQYTLGMCLNSGGTWYCSAVIQFWAGRELTAGGNTSEIADNWYYSCARWPGLCGHQPAYGELVGVFVAAGNLRDSNNWAVEQRSNVVMMPFGTDYAK